MSVCINEANNLYVSNCSHGRRAKTFTKCSWQVLIILKFYEMCRYLLTFEQESYIKTFLFSFALSKNPFLQSRPGDTDSYLDLSARIIKAVSKRNRILDYFDFVSTPVSQH